MKHLTKKIDGLALILPIILLLLWYFMSRSNRIPEYLFPSPERLIQVIIDFILGKNHITPYSGMFIENLIASGIRVFFGFGIASFFGIVLGFLTGRINIIKRIFDPFIHMVRTVPGIGWLPLSMVWFGIGEKTTVFLIALAAFFPIYINVAHGASEVPELYIRAGRMLGASKLTLFFQCKSIKEKSLLFWDQVVAENRLS